MTPGELRQILIEQCQLIIAERSGGEREAGRLLDHRLQYLRMAVALVDRRVRGEAIEVSPTVDIPYPAPFSSGQHDVQRLVVVGAEPQLAGDEAGGRNRRLFTGLHAG